MGAVRRCGPAMAGPHEQAVTNLIIDDRKSPPHQLAGAVRSVEAPICNRARLGRRNQSWTR